MISTPSQIPIIRQHTVPTPFKEVSLLQYPELTFIHKNEKIKQSLQKVFDDVETYKTKFASILVDARNNDLISLDAKIARLLYLKEEIDVIYPTAMIECTEDKIINFCDLFALCFYLYYESEEITFNEFQTILGILQVHWTYIEHPSNIYYSGERPNYECIAEASRSKRELKKLQDVRTDLLNKVIHCKTMNL
jgi:hypothetical protein